MKSVQSTGRRSFRPAVRDRQASQPKAGWASGWSKSKTVKAIYEKGYSGSISNAFEQLCKIEKKENKCFEPQPYVRTMTECLKYKTGSTGKEKDYITREGVFRHMWMNTELTDDHKKYIYDKYPTIWELHCCIKEFRNIFKKRNVPLLYLFVGKGQTTRLSLNPFLVHT